MGVYQELVIHKRKVQKGEDGSAWMPGSDRSGVRRWLEESAHRPKIKHTRQWRKK